MVQHTSLELLPEILTPREGALIMRCSAGHFCNLLDGRVAGLPRISHFRLGRRRLVRKATLAAWIEQLESKARQR